MSVPRISAILLAVVVCFAAVDAAAESMPSATIWTLDTFDHSSAVPRAIDLCLDGEKCVPVPEPSTRVLFSCGLAGLLIFGRKAFRR